MSKKKGMTTLQADTLLMLVTLGWGISYVLMDLCLTDLGTFTLNMFRFLIASSLAFAFRSKYVLRKINKETVKLGTLIGIFLFLVYLCATLGIQHTSVANTGFLCASTVVFTPVFSFVFLKKKMDLKTTISVISCFIGMAILTIGKGFSINKDTIFGDLICIGCGFFYAFDLLLTEKAVGKDNVDAYTLGTINLFVVGVLNLIFGLFFEDVHFPMTSKVWIAMLFLAVFSTGFAFIIQPIAQKYTTASRVGIIFTLEPLFNVVAAVLILNETISIRQIIGSTIMVISIFILEIDFKDVRKIKKDE